MKRIFTAAVLAASFLTGTALADVQQVSPDPLKQAVPANSAVSFDAIYTTDPKDEALTGIGFYIHWDSSKLTFQDLENIFSENFLSEGDPEDDTGDLDNDPNTDRRVLIAWSDFSPPASWSGPGSQPATLFTANFSTTSTFAEATNINFTPTSGHTGWTFAGTSATIDVGTVCETTVPDVIGLSQAAATAKLITEDLTTGVLSPGISSTVPEGHVMDQTPVKDTVLACQAPVDLVISTLEGACEVPDVVGMSQSVAEATLVKENLTTGDVTETHSDTVAKGFVIAQGPGSGSLVGCGTAVNLTVSLGPEEVSCTVPDVVGMSQSAAELTLAEAKLTTGNVTTDHSDTVAEDDVISQAPVEGSEVACESAVDLVVSLGPIVGSCTVPDVVGMTEDAAMADIAAADLQTGDVDDEFSETEAGIVFAQDPAGGGDAICKTFVDFTVSLGQAVMVPNVIEATVSEAETEITDAGLTVGRTSMQCTTNDVPQDIVLSQDPDAGTDVPSGSAVDLGVSNGQPCAVSPIPTLSQWGMILLGLLLAAISMVTMRANRNR